MTLKLWWHLLWTGHTKHTHYVLDKPTRLGGKWKVRYSCSTCGRPQEAS